MDRLIPICRQNPSCTYDGGGFPADPKPVKYDEDDDWNELPSKAREAAEVLGYSEELWDKDREPPSCDKYWKDLSPKEKCAAIMLGYTEDKWNDSSSSGSSTS